MRDAAVAGERAAEGPAGDKAGVRRRGQRAAARGTAGVAAVVHGGHQGDVALVPVRRHAHQPRVDGRGPGRVVLLQRAGHLRGHRQPRGAAGLQAGPV